MRENESVLLVLSVCDGEIILKKGEILSEKRHSLMVISPILCLMLIQWSYSYKATITRLVLLSEGLCYNLAIKPRRV